MASEREKEIDLEESMRIDNAFLLTTKRLALIQHFKENNMNCIVRANRLSMGCEGIKSIGYAQVGESQRGID